MKDYLFERLEDDTLNDKPDEMVEEVYPQEIVSTNTPPTQESFKKKISHAKKWWKQV